MCVGYTKEGKKAGLGKPLLPSSGDNKTVHSSDF